jgi:shikimate dehydrogenase
MGFVGVNLTVPHKLLAVAMVDALDQSAREWGAVNTVRFEGKDDKGAWRPLHELSGRPAQVRSQGFNTDADAITRSLQEDLGLEPKGASVLLLGAGGAGRTAALKMAAEGVAQLYLVNRTKSKALELQRELRDRYPSTKVVTEYPSGAVDLVLNATSLGLKTDDALPLDVSRFSLERAGAVYDMIYRPAQTPFLKAAAAAGRKVCNGAGMLLYQGAAALEIWSGKPAPVEVMRQALLKNIYS